ncbi:MAG: VWA domain-containing protein [Planctomycetota bacterium]
MGLEHPWALCLPPLVLALALVVRRRRAGAGLPSVAAPSEEGGAPSRRVRMLPVTTFLAAVALLGASLAAAGPYAGARPLADRRRARDIVIALDASESMRAVDFRLEGDRASRMQAALRFVRRFVRRRRGDRIGIVAFGATAVTQCPLTFDRDVALRLLDYVEAEALGKRTALGEAVALATGRLPRGGATVLVTDGRDTAGPTGPRQAARAARSRGVRVYAVGVGSEGPAPVPGRLPSGRVRLEMKDYPLDEATLRAVAELTGGAYFRATDADALGRVFREIDRLEARPVSDAKVVPLRPLSGWAGAVAAAALCALLVVGSTALRTAPRMR